MVIYEVNLLIDNEIYSDYKSWLDEHILEMLKIPGFVDATVLRPKMDDERNTKDKTSVTVQYQLESAEDLEKYLQEYAPKMRGDGINRFEGRFSATRRVLEVEEVINANKYAYHV